MKNLYLGLILSMLSIVVFSQENAYSSFDVSLNNSIKLNRFLINPAFSYAREIAPSINLANKRQWVKFEDSPVLYFLNYQGRLSNESRFGIGVYSQSIGLLKNNGGLLNYALNVPMENESNLTFGVNAYFSSSNLDTNRAITETTEPLFSDLTATTLISVKPGINLQLNNFDIGISANNIISYNLTTSESVQENNSSSFSGHLMYTKEISSFYNILDGSNLSTMIQLDNRKDGTAISGNILIDQRDLGWLEVGYNTIRGANAGVGIAVSKKFFIGYSYNLSLNNSLFFGSSHEFSLSYSFREYSDSYNFIKRAQKLREKTATKANGQSPKKDNSTDLADKLDKEQARKDRLEELRLQREEAKLAKEEKVRLAKEAADAKAKALLDNKTKIEEQNNADKAEKDRLAKEAAERAQAEKDRLAKEAAERAQAEKDRLAKEAAEAKAQAERDRLAIEAAKSKAEKDRLAKEAAERAQAEKDRLAKEAAERAQAEKDRLAKEAAERAQAEKDRLAKEAAERAQAEKDRLAKEAAERAQAEKDRLAKEAAERAQAEKDRLAKEAAERAQAEKDRLAKEAAERAQAEKDRLAKEAAERAQAEKDRLAKEAAEKAQAEKDRLAKEAAEKAQAEKDRLAKEAAERAQAEKDRLAKAAAEAQAEKDRLAREAALRAQAEKERLAKEAAEAQAEKDRLAREAALKAQAEKERLAKEAAEAQAEKDRLAREAALKAQAEKERLAKEAAEAQAEKDRLAREAALRAQAEKERLAKEAAEAQAEKDRLAREAALKAQAEKDRLAKEAVKSNQSIEEKVLSIETKLNVSNKVLDNYKREIAQKTKNSDNLIKRLDSIVKVRELDLQAYISENDPNFKAGPQKFVSTSQQNAQLNAIKNEIAANKKVFDDLIIDFESANRRRLDELKKNGVSDEEAKELNKYYDTVIADLKNKKQQYLQFEKIADERIKKVIADKEEERLKRIKRAEYVNEVGRIEEDQRSLEQIKNSTSQSTNTSTSNVTGQEEEVSNDISIIKKLNGVASGFYLVLGKFKSIPERDAFVRQVVAGGGTSVTLFYNIYDATYYVYIDRFDELPAAMKGLQARGTKSYNKRMSIVKVE